MQKQAFVDIRNLSELLNESPDIVDSPNAVELPRPPKDVGMSLEFRDVWFWYPSQPRSAGLDRRRGLCFVFLFFLLVFSIVVFGRTEMVGD